MSVTAITPDYVSHTETRDLQKNFHGNMVVYFHWEEHLAFCAALAFPLPPGMPFGALTAEVLPTYYGAHPDMAKVDWTQVIWVIDGEKATPDFSKSLEENGLHHKSLVRFWTPGLHGRAGS
jgi:phenol hydroxylase P4 protein